MEFGNQPAQQYAESHHLPWRLVARENVAGNYVYDAPCGFPSDVERFFTDYILASAYRKFDHTVILVENRTETGWTPVAFWHSKSLVLNVENELPEPYLLGALQQVAKGNHLTVNRGEVEQFLDEQAQAAAVAQEKARWLPSGFKEFFVQELPGIEAREADLNKLLGQSAHEDAHRNRLQRQGPADGGLDEG